MTLKLIAAVGAVLLVSATGALAQKTVSTAATPSSNGKTASQVTTTPLEDPTLGSGQSKAMPKGHMRKHGHKHAAAAAKTSADT